MAPAARRPGVSPTRSTPCALAALLSVAGAASLRAFRRSSLEQKRAGPFFCGVTSLRYTLCATPALVALLCVTSTLGRSRSAAPATVICGTHPTSASPKRDFVLVEKKLAQAPPHCYDRQRRAGWRPANAGRARFGAARGTPGVRRPWLTTRSRRAVLLSHGL